MLTTNGSVLSAAVHGSRAEALRGFCHLLQRTQKELAISEKVTRHLCRPSFKFELYVLMEVLPKGRLSFSPLCS